MLIREDTESFFSFFTYVGGESQNKVNQAILCQAIYAAPLNMPMTGTSYINFYGFWGLESISFSGDYLDTNVDV